MRLIDAEALKKALKEKFDDFIPEGVYDEINNAPTVNPCNNCDLYFKAMTKEEMRKGDAECTSFAKLDNMPMISKKHKGGAEND